MIMKLLHVHTYVRVTACNLLTCLTCILIIKLRMLEVRSYIVPIKSKYFGAGVCMLLYEGSYQSVTV